MNTMPSMRALWAAWACTLLAAQSCTDAPLPVAPDTGPPPNAEVIASSHLVSVPFAGQEHTFFPFTASAASFDAADDPINLLLEGDADPRAVRAALMFLSGNRAGTPFAPFNCRWTDAIGGVQSAYGIPEGWSGGAVQLECGSYGLRFHARLFDMGSWTLGGVHYELLVPGTPEHRILNWDVAREFLFLDVLRTGLVTSAGISGVIGPTPTYREIEVPLYNALPLALRFLIGGPLTNITTPFQVPSSGQARLAALNGELGEGTGIARQELVLQLGQIVPTPFCVESLGPAIRIEGPVTLRQIVNYTPAGTFVSQFHAIGQITVTSVNPFTGEPTGEPHSAIVNEHHRGIATDQVTLVSFFQMQGVIPGIGRLYMNVQVGPGDVAHEDARVDC